MVKRVMRKRRGKKPRRGRKRGRAMVKKEVMVNKMPRRLHTVIAPHYFTTLEYGFTGSATLAAGAQGYFNVWANGLFTPGNNLGGATAGGGQATVNFVLFTGAGFGGTLYPATLALNALNPVGETQLSVLYGKYRVHSSKISVTCTPVSGSPDCLLSVLPIDGNSLEAGLPGNDIQRAQSQPFAKAIQVSPNNNLKQNTVQNKCQSHTILGLTKAQYKDDPLTAGLTSATNPSGFPTSIGGNNASPDGVFWQVNVSPMRAADTPLNLYEIRVIYFAEFFEPVAMLDT